MERSTGLGLPNLAVKVTSMYGEEGHGAKPPRAKTIWNDEVEAPSRWRTKLPAERRAGPGAALGRYVFPLLPALSPLKGSCRRASPLDRPAFLRH